MKSFVPQVGFPKSTPRLWPIGVALLLSMGSTAWAGFHISGTQLLDGNDRPFVLRGINEPHVWFPERTQSAIADIASAGIGPGRANCIRFVCGTGDRWPKTTAADLLNLIAWSKAKRIIAVLEVHDCTGWPDDEKAAKLPAAARYWASMAAALRGTEDYAIINLANEPFGNRATNADYFTATRDAIATIRQAGITHTLMIDGASWGQDEQGFMYDNAAALWSADPRKNLLFSVHIYGAYTSRAQIDSYLSKFLALGLPLVVGEFGNSNGPGVIVDWKDVMERCDHYHVGYLGWSWSGNNRPYAKLDMVENFALPLNAWGKGVFNGPDGRAHGISQTAVPCTIFP